MMVWSHILMNCICPSVILKSLMVVQVILHHQPLQFGEPTESWGIRATPTGTITNGVLTSIDMISNGRGYTLAPAVTIGSAVQVPPQPYLHTM